MIKNKLSYGQPVAWPSLPTIASSKFDVSGFQFLWKISTIAVMENQGLDRVWTMYIIYYYGARAPHQKPLWNDCYLNLGILT